MCSVLGLCFKKDRSRGRLTRGSKFWKSGPMSNGQRNCDVQSGKEEIEMVLYWGCRVGGMEHAAAFKCLKVFVWTLNRLALQCFKGWKTQYNWKLEGRKFLLNICPSLLMVADIDQPSKYARHSVKLFLYMTLLIYYSLNPYINSARQVLLFSFYR